jgi:hypothetical protein
LHNYNAQTTNNNFENRGKTLENLTTKRSILYTDQQNKKLFFQKFVVAVLKFEKINSTCISKENALKKKNDKKPLKKN